MACVPWPFLRCGGDARVSTLGYVAASTFDRYQNVPATVNYYFSDRGAFRFDDISALDLSVNYRLKLGRAEFFMQPEVINVVNDAAFTGGQGILTADNDDTLRAFNPFTETPVEGVHWRKADTFGQARNVNDYQLGRTYRLSAGIRF